MCQIRWVIISLSLAAALVHNSMETNLNDLASLNTALNTIESANVGNLGTVCVGQHAYQLINVTLSTWRFKPITRIVDTLSDVLSSVNLQSNVGAARSMTSALVNADPLVTTARLGLIPPGARLQNGANGRPSMHSVQVVTYPTNNQDLSAWQQVPEDVEPPWLALHRATPKHNLRMPRNVEASERGVWSFPYFSCTSRQWLITYLVRVPRTSVFNHSRRAIISVDVKLTSLSIDQCGNDAVEHRSTASNKLEHQNSTNSPAIDEFANTHKCVPHTSQCLWQPGGGWTRGSYRCKCRDGFFSKTGQPWFDGRNVEVAYEEMLIEQNDTSHPDTNKQRHSENAFNTLYACSQCQPGCDTCSSDRPCKAVYRWPLRIFLLTLSMLCVLVTFVLILLIVYFRRFKVIKTASPIFLIITLFGCAVMYMEMAAIFPILDRNSCIATKWTRHMGFCITYSSLLLKTWRVSLTYRVKSAHKIKLTDKQLLQWLCPILLIMMIYMSTWTVSDPPGAVRVTDGDNLHYLQCHFGWWDHCLAVGEIVFLCWGIWVCVNVRHAPSLFDEAKYICWAIYNIAVVNAVMAIVHVLVVSGPDVKYVLGLVRVQLSTTTTIVLVFAPKLHRIFVGRGNEYDAGARDRVTTACIDISDADNESVSILRENDELKEEIQKLAAHVEFLKIMNMETDNRHLKPRKDGYFSAQTRRKSSIGLVLKLEARNNDQHQQQRHQLKATESVSE